MTNKTTREEILEAILASEESEGETHMRHFYEAVDAGVQPTAETMQFLANAFKEIYKMDSHDGDVIKKTLQLSKDGRGRPTASNEHMVIAYRVEELYLSGKGLNEARRIIAGESGVSEDTVKRHYRKHKRFVKFFIESQNAALKSKALLDSSLKTAMKAKALSDSIDQST